MAAKHPHTGRVKVSRTLSLSLSLGWAYLSHSAEATYWAHGATLSVCMCA